MVKRVYLIREVKYKWVCPYCFSMNTDVFRTIKREKSWCVECRGCVIFINPEAAIDDE